MKCTKCNFSFCRFAYSPLDSDCLEERPVTTLISALKARLLARKYQQLWHGSISSRSDMEAAARKVVLDWQQLWYRYDSLRGSKLLKSDATVFKSWHSRKGMVNSTKVVTTSEKNWQNFVWTRKVRDPDQGWDWLVWGFIQRRRVGNSCRWS